MLGDVARDPRRSFHGAAAEDLTSSNDKLDGCTYVGDASGPLKAFWIERIGDVVSVSKRGGAAFSGGSRKSDRYPPGTKPYVFGASYLANDVIGAMGKIYRAEADGVADSVWPSHTTGTVTHGTLPLAFVDYSYTVPMAFCGAVIADFKDGQAAWQSYGEGVLTDGGGVLLLEERDAGTLGPPVVTHPWNMTPDQSSYVYWTCAGLSCVTPTSPTSAAYGIAKNNAQFLAGIVVGQDAIATGGYFAKLANKAEHAFGWFNSAGQVVSLFYSLGTNNNERVAAAFANRAWNLYCVGGLMASDESAAAAGTQPTDRVRRIAFAGTGYAEMRAQNITSQPSDLLLAGSNGGKVRFGTFQPVTSATVVGYIEVKDASGVLRKLAVIE